MLHFVAVPKKVWLGKYSVEEKQARLLIKMLFACAVLLVIFHRRLEL
jgi:hypothetical protein